jgi:SsrA-binding protein
MAEVKIISRNKKIFRNYEILDKIEAGIVLVGTEIKSVRAASVSFRDSFIDINKGEIWLVGFYIAHYTEGNIWNHNEDRKRKLLLNKREIRKWDTKVKERGFTIVPIDIYLKEGKAKMTIGLARGKTGYDRRVDIKDRDMKRETERYTKNLR